MASAESISYRTFCAVVQTRKKRVERDTRKLGNIAPGDDQLIRSVRYRTNGRNPCRRAGMEQSYWAIY